MNDESVEKTRKFVEELEKKMYNLEKLEEIYNLEKPEWDADVIATETYRVENYDIVVIFIKKEGEYDIGRAASIYRSPFGIIEIDVYVPYPNKNLRDVLEENRSLKRDLYFTLSHEYAHLDLVNKLNENDLEKFKEILKVLRKYGEKLSLAYSETQRRRAFLELAEFYIDNLLPLNAHSEVYTCSTSLLFLIDALEMGKISIEDVEEVFRKNLYTFSLRANRFPKYIAEFREKLRTNNYSEISFEDLRVLDYFFASHIILSILVRELNEYQLVDLYENFKKNIKTVKELFRKIKQYAENKFFEKLRK
jgi:hypothetical protein